MQSCNPCEPLLSPEGSTAAGFESNCDAHSMLQEIELSTGDFRASSAFAEGLLACAAHAGNWLQRIRVVQALPGRQCSPKVVYGDKGTRLEMYRGAQVRPCASISFLYLLVLHRDSFSTCSQTFTKSAWNFGKPSMFCLTFSPVIHLNAAAMSS